MESDFGSLINFGLTNTMLLDWDEFKYSLSTSNTIVAVALSLLIGAQAKLYQARSIKLQMRQLLNIREL